MVIMHAKWTIPESLWLEGVDNVNPLALLHSPVLKNPILSCKFIYIYIHPIFGVDTLISDCTCICVVDGRVITTVNEPPQPLNDEIQIKTERFQKIPQKSNAWRPETDNQTRFYQEKTVGKRKNRILTQGM